MRRRSVVALVVFAVLVVPWLLRPRATSSMIPASSSSGLAPSAADEGGEPARSRIASTANDAPAVEKIAQRKAEPSRTEPRQPPPHRVRVTVLKPAGPQTSPIRRMTARAPEDSTCLLADEAPISTALAFEGAVSQRASRSPSDGIPKIEGSAEKRVDPQVVSPAVPGTVSPREPILTPPSILSQTPPEYPSEGYSVILNRTSLTPQLRIEAAEGRVILRLLVLADGSVDRVEVVVSSGHEVLDQTAVEAVKIWRFAPATRDRQPIKAWVVIPVRFVVP